MYCWTMMYLHFLNLLLTAYKCDTTSYKKKCVYMCVALRLRVLLHTSNMEVCSVLLVTDIFSLPTPDLQHLYLYHKYESHGQELD